MEAKEDPEDVLLQRPWLPVNISGLQLQAKSCFSESSYQVLLTDMQCVWEERMEPAAIQKRAQELNRRLRAPVEAFFSHLSQVVKPFLSGGDGPADGKAQMSVTCQDGNMNMKLKSELAGLPFYWEFHCTPAPIAMVCVQLVRPLLAMNHLLRRQVDQLSGLLVRKDAEIQDYRENGATLSRERLQTDAYEQQTCRKDFMTKTLPLLSGEQHQPLSFDSDLQQLYADVVAHIGPRKRKHRASDEKEEKEDADDQHSAAEPDLTSSLAEAGAQSQDRPTAEKPKAQQSLPAAPNPQQRTSSKPKKKKVGLFR